MNKVLSNNQFFHNSNTYKVFSQDFEKYLNNYLNHSLLGTQTLKDAIKFTVLSQGKRLRPFLMYLTGVIFKIDTNSLYHIGLALEFIHTYSLIHDDLPALDNDDTRRGKPSCHKQFTESTAILAGDSLLTLAFTLLSDNSLSIEDGVKLKIINITSKFLGLEGMISGQELDLINSKNLLKSNSLNKNDILNIHTLKTAKFIELPFFITSLIVNLTHKRHNHFTSFGNILGVIFQILDDIEDYNPNINSVNLLNFLSNQDIKNYLKVIYNQAMHELQEASITSTDLISFLQYLYDSCLFLLDNKKYV